MNKYSVIVEGSNLYLEREHGISRMGLYATRWVEARNEAEAIKAAIGLIRDELSSLCVLKNDPDDQPTFELDEIEELLSFTGLTPPGTGFTFYPDDSPMN